MICSRKKKKQNELNELLDKMQSMMFPGGKEEMQQQVVEVSKQMHNHYNSSDVANGLCYMTSLMFTAQDKSAERIGKGQLHRPDNVLSEQDVMILYKYVVRQQFKKIFHTDDEQSFNEFYVSLGNIEGGSKSDVIQGAYGEYGLCATNPIPVRGIPSNEVYLKSLSLVSGEEFSWIRHGSTSATNISHPIDVYKITTNSGVEVCNIYISPYQSVTSKKAPKGFVIE